MSFTVGELNAYLGVDDRDYYRKLDKAEGHFSRFGGRMGRVSGMVGKAALGAAVGGIAALGAGLAAGGYAGMKYNSSIEQTTIAMGTMLGSTSKAKTLIGEVTEMAAATPFEFPELADATKRLVAYGVAAEDAVPLMTRLGDVSSALNIPVGELSDVYGKMKVGGQIYMEDINQLAGRGIPIYKALADVMHKPQAEIRGLVEQGKVGFPQIEAAFESMTDKGSMFGGMMEKQSQSFAGQWSTLVDDVTQIFGKLMKPAFEWLTKTGMPALNKALPTISDVISGVMSGIGGAFEAIGPYLSLIFDWFAENGPAIISIVEKMAGIWLSAMKPAIEQVGPLFREMGETIGVWIDFIKDNWGTIGPAVEAILDVIGTAFALVAGIVRTILAVLRGDWKSAWENLKKVVSLALGLIWKMFGAFGKLWKAAFKLAWKLIKNVGSDALDGIKKAVSDAWGWIGSKTSSAWSGVLRTIGGFVNKIIDLVNKLPGVDIEHVSWGSQTLRTGVGPHGYAQGKRVTRPELALVGEEGPELILPLTKPRRMAQLLAEVGITAFGDGGLVGAIGGALKGTASSIWSGAKTVLGGIQGLLDSVGVPDMPSMLKGFLPAVLKLLAGKLKDVVTSAAKSLSGGIDTSGLSGGLKQIVTAISKRYRWNANDWLQLIMHESGGRMTATNPTSGAYGIAQGWIGPGKDDAADHARWYASHGGNWLTLVGQLTAMANYIRGRYSTPSNAWQTWLGRSPHWYGSGGDFVAYRPQVIGVGDHGPERVQITPVGSETRPTIINEFDFNGAIFVDSTRQGIQRLFDLVVRGDEAIGTQKARLSPS